MAKKSTELDLLRQLEKLVRTPVTNPVPLLIAVKKLFKKLDNVRKKV